MKWEDFCDKGAKQYIQELEQKLQQKENIIKEVREYIEDERIIVGKQVERGISGSKQELLEILDKESEVN